MNLKERVLNNICYTELVYQRVNKKLATSYSKKEIEGMLLTIIKDTDSSAFIEKGKNVYISN